MVGDQDNLDVLRLQVDGFFATAGLCAVACIVWYSLLASPESLELIRPATQTATVVTLVGHSDGAQPTQVLLDTPGPQPTAPPPVQESLYQSLLNGGFQGLGTL